MIERHRGDILHAEVEALVNTVNCVGVMGRGIALQFRKAFPDNYKMYKAVCDRRELRPGRVLVHEVRRLGHPLYIINFPTKRHWRGKSRMEDIESGLKALVEEVRKRKISSIAVPPLGSGLGGLDWEEVRPRIEAAFEALPTVEVLLFEPAGAPRAERMVRAKTRPRMTVGRAALLGLMRRYLTAVMDPAITLLEIHKLMYFMQERGEDLKLRYTKGPYGPYADNLRHVLSLVEGHFLTGFGDAEDRPDRHIELLPEAASEAEKFLEDHRATRERFDSVGDLINGFETPYGMELLSTVHWVATREGAGTEDDTVAVTYSWSSRKRMLKERHVRMAWNIMQEQGWLRTA